MAVAFTPVARGPLVDLHRRGGAKLEIVDGWETALSYPRETGIMNALVDLSHWPTHEINGRDTAAALTQLCGSDVPVRSIRTSGAQHAYRLTPSRAILFGYRDLDGGALDVTGGWTSLALVGPDAEKVLSKVTAVDLRERTLPVGSCCQGPLFAVNTLFGRLPDRFELHVCSDSAEFFWDVLMDAGAEFDLKPAGLEFYRARVS